MRFSIDFLIFALVFQWFFIDFPLNHEKFSATLEGALSTLASTTSVLLAAPVPSQATCLSYIILALLVFSEIVQVTMCIKFDDFVSKMMNFVSKMMNFGLKMMNLMQTSREYSLTSCTKTRKPQVANCNIIANFILELFVENAEIMENCP